MSTIDCTIKLSDVKTLIDSITRKILFDEVVCNYLCRAWESFSINQNEELLVEWSIKDYLDVEGRECVDLGYISFSELLNQLEEKDYLSVCERLVKDCERVFYDAYHERSSNAFPLEFLMDKVKRLRFVI